MSVATPTGLSSVEAAQRLGSRGPNEIERQTPTPRWRLAADQITSPLVLLLIAGAALSAFVAEIADAVAITVIVGINAVIGYNQERRAERAVLALRAMTARRARVIRDGHRQLISARTVVVGDVLALEPGDVIAADARVLQGDALTVDEAVLTGESMPVKKHPEPTDDDTPLAARHDHVHLGTTVATGTGLAEVSTTGMGTEMGRIADLLARQPRDETPLQARLRGLGRVLVLACLVAVAIVGALGVLHGLGWMEVLMTAISLAVAAVPEGLPAVVTVTLALGVRHMSARQVLVRRLASVETLGCATVICTDKTGTLTTGQMEVRAVWGPDHRATLFAAAACCEADLDTAHGVGNPTEMAILRAAAKQGIDRDTIERDQPRVRVIPFETQRRRMAIARADGKIYVKGAPEVVLDLCSEQPEGATEAVDGFAKRGLRVLAIAVGSGSEERDLTLVGLVGIADAPRAESIEAIAAAHRAGIRVVMITGDHPLTAHAIAREMGIVGPGESPEGRVYARATAEDKTEIVDELRRAGEVVAMTGDGVNDAPSIRAADIGIAMGRTATEVTREASDMILGNDDLSGIVAAIGEGRAIYGNIRKAIVYLLGGNSAELVLMLVASAIALPLPLLPLHLLWINLMTEPLPGLALAVDPPTLGLLDDRPRPRHEPLLGRSQWIHITWVAVLQASVALFAYSWALPQGLTEARTLAFTTLVFGILLRALAARDPDRVLWRAGLVGNVRIAVVVAVSLCMQLGLIYAAPTQRLFEVTGLGLRELGIAAALGFVPVTAVELGKVVRYIWRRSRPTPKPPAPRPEQFGKPVERSA